LFPHKKSDSEVFFQLRKQPADNRLRDFQALSRGCGGPKACHRFERFYLFEVHPSLSI